MKAIAARLLRDNQGQDLIEYALLGSFVSLAAYLGANFLGTELNNWYNSVGDAVKSAETKVPVIPSN